MTRSHQFIAELPYYRVRPQDWASTLKDMARSDVDVVSFYVPWRLHERVVDGIAEYDFDGDTHPQTDVRHFLCLIKTAGLKALVKPGPFIHAEVQFGGIPDRIILDSGILRHTGWDNRTLPSQGEALPSFFDPVFQRETEKWLRILTTEVLQRHIDDGTITTFQLGNEGVLGELCHAVEAVDVSSAALPHLSACSGIDLDRLSASLPKGPEVWDDRLRSALCDWSAEAPIVAWDWLSDHLPQGPARLVNIPLSSGDGPAVYSWLRRMNRLRRLPYRIGHTEWVGNVTREASAFFSHCAEIQLLQSDAAETNWGFTWTDQSFADGATPAFHSLLALMLGSRTVSAYCACVGQEWHDAIDMSAEGVRKDGLDPTLFEPPYCYGAPFQDGAPGAGNPNRATFDRLAAFLKQYGESLSGSRLMTGDVVTLRLDHVEKRALGLPVPGHDPLDNLRSAIMTNAAIPGVTHDQRAGDVIDLQLETGRVSDEFAATSKDKHVRVIVRYNQQDAVWWIGAFNPSSKAGRLDITRNGRVQEFHVHPHNARIVRCDTDAKVAFDTPFETPAVATTEPV